VSALPPFSPAVNEITAEFVVIEPALSAVGAKGTTVGTVTESADELVLLPALLTAFSMIEYVVP
jgi:hypothetical protein